MECQPRHRAVLALVRLDLQPMNAVVGAGVPGAQSTVTSCQAASSRQMFHPIPGSEPRTGETAYAPIRIRRRVIGRGKSTASNGDPSDRLAGRRRRGGCAVNVITVSDRLEESANRRNLLNGCHGQAYPLAHAFSDLRPVPRTSEYACPWHPERFLIPPLGGFPR